MTTPVNSLGALEAAFRESLTRYHHALGTGGRKVSAIQNDLVADLVAAAGSFAYALPSRPHRLPPYPDTRYVAEQARQRADKLNRPTARQVAARQRELLVADQRWRDGNRLKAACGAAAAESGSSHAA